MIGPAGGELLVQHRLRHVGVKVPHIQGGERVGGAATVHCNVTCDILAERWTTKTGILIVLLLIPVAVYNYGPPIPKTKFYIATYALNFPRIYT